MVNVDHCYLSKNKSQYTAASWKWITSNPYCLFRRYYLNSLYCFYFYKSDSRCKICPHLRFLWAELLKHLQMTRVVIFIHHALSRSLSPTVCLLLCCPRADGSTADPPPRPPVLMKTLRVLARLHLSPRPLPPPPLPEGLSLTIDFSSGLLDRQNKSAEGGVGAIDSS